MIYKLLITLALSFLNGMFYRMGGSGNYPRWTRPLGIGLYTIATIFIWAGFHLDLWEIFGVIASGGISAGMSTTYFKKKGADAHWFNWAFVGFALSLSLLPLAWTHNLWLGLLIRTVILTPAITLWSQFIGLDILEENGRGFLHIATIPLMFI